mmetsp:Transcript_31660/g.91713  ORF Transcript_31660/g.91713 Transcript_31660/m.91713 type:complete len:138 (-) Transcript_31660:827-1240(-)
MMATNCPTAHAITRPRHTPPHTATMCMPLRHNAILTLHQQAMDDKTSHIHPYTHTSQHNTTQHPHAVPSPSRINSSPHSENASARQQQPVQQQGVAGKKVPQWATAAPAGHSQVAGRSGCGNRQHWRGPPSQVGRIA